MAEWYLTMKSFNLKFSVTFWPRGHVISHVIQKMLYIHFHKTYEHQTWQDDTLQWKVSIYNFQWPFDPVVTWYHMLFKECYISTSIRPMNTKLGRMISYNEKFPFTIFSDLLAPWSRDIIHVIQKMLYIHFHKTYEH